MTVKRALNHTPDSTAAKFYVNNPRLKSLRATYQVLEDTILSEAGIATLSTSMQTITMSQSEYALYTEFKKGKLGLEAQG